MKKSQFIICSAIFLACLVIYFANGNSITSNDDVPTSLLAFNWLENHQLNFDFFRDNPFIYNDTVDFSGKQSPYFFIETSNGHVSAKYPIGPAILSFPIYSLFFLGIRIFDGLHTLFTGIPTDSLDLSSQAFLLSQRTNYETISATLLTALSVVLFYLASRLKFGQSTALLSTFIFGCSTSVWVVCSQGLRQHTVSNLVLLAAMLALFKANRTIEAPQKLLLVLAGFFAGLLHSSRPTSLLFFAALIAYCIYTYRKNCLYFFVGTSSILIGMAWNVYYFGISNFLKGGYADLTSQVQTYSLKYFPESAVGLLLSPNRGWLTLCPILLFAIPGIRRIFRWPSSDDEKLLACLSLACVALYVQYCFYFAWTGVLVYGPSRFLVDVLPVLCFLINYYLYTHFQHAELGAKKLWNGVFIIFFACLIFSTFVQAVGAFGNNSWATIPTPNKERLWKIDDSVVERTTRGIIFDIQDPIDNRREYVAGLQGQVLEFTDSAGYPARRDVVVRAGKVIRLRLDLENTGTSPWYGYETGTKWGLLQAVVRFETLDGAGVGSHRKSKIYVEGGTIQPGETAIAVGDVKFPSQPGPYNMVVMIEASGIDELTDIRQSIRVHILSRHDFKQEYGETLSGFEFQAVPVP